MIVLFLYILYIQYQKPVPGQYFRILNGSICVSAYLGGQGLQDLRPSQLPLIPSNNYFEEYGRAYGQTGRVVDTAPICLRHPIERLKRKDGGWCRSPVTRKTDAY